MPKNSVIVRVPIPLDKLRRALASAAWPGYFGRVSVEIRITPDVTVDRLQTFSGKAAAAGDEQDNGRTILVDAAVEQLTERMIVIADDSPSTIEITGHYADGRLQRYDLQQLQRV